MAKMKRRKAIKKLSKRRRALEYIVFCDGESTRHGTIEEAAHMAFRHGSRFYEVFEVAGTVSESVLEEALKAFRLKETTYELKSARQRVRELEKACAKIESTKTRKAEKKREKSRKEFRVLCDSRLKDGGSSLYKTTHGVFIRDGRRESETIGEIFMYDHGVFAKRAPAWVIAELSRYEEEQ